MTSPNPRDVLRDRLAVVMAQRWRERAQACVEDSPEGHCADLAEVVLGLFREVEREGKPGPRLPWVRWRTPGHFEWSRYVLRTSPEPVEETS
jgi:hypothetical protein